MNHTIHPELLRNTVNVMVVGCGGNGCAIAAGLPYLHQGLLAYGHPGGLHVTLVDGDTISATNCIRQPFCRSEIGLPKSVVLANRVNIQRSDTDDRDIIRITSPNGRNLQFSYDGSHRITQVSDSIGRTVFYTYDTNGRLATVKDVNGGTTTYTYSTSVLDEMLTIKDPKGIVYLTNQYDSNERVTKQTLANNLIPSFRTS